MDLTDAIPSPISKRIIRFNLGLSSSVYSVELDQRNVESIHDTGVSPRYSSKLDLIEVAQIVLGLIEMA